MKQLILLFTIATISCTQSNDIELTGTWSANITNNILQIGYGIDNWPQYIALHLDSSYLRMIPSENTGWGTSICILPIFWESGELYQGTTIDVSTSTSNNIISIAFSGTIKTTANNELTSNGTIDISPPENNVISAKISIKTTGSISLDPNQGNESYKFGFLSSMKIDENKWDSNEAVIDSSTTYSIPNATESNWILEPITPASSIQLTGGSNNWKTNAPTIKIELLTPTTAYPAGWITASDDPNDDNTALWFGTDTMINSIEYIATYSMND